LGFELATGDGGERIYIAEPTGPTADAPNLRERNSRAIQRSPVAPASCCSGSRERSRSGKATPPQRLKEMKDHLERLKAQGIEAID
jgi:Rifampin ADP-ribosyl transferase